MTTALDTRTRTLQAAARLLAEHGPSGLSVRGIAAEAGLSTIGIYHYFGGKDGIIEALYQDGFQALEEALATVSKTDDPLADIIELALAYFKVAQSRPTYYEIMFSRPVPGFQPSPESLARAMRTWNVYLEAMERCEAAGLLNVPPVDAALLLWSSGHGLLMLQLAGNVLASADTERLMRSGTATLLRAVTKPGVFDAQPAAA